MCGTEDLGVWRWRVANGGWRVVTSLGMCENLAGSNPAETAQGGERQLV